MKKPDPNDIRWHLFFVTTSLLFLPRFLPIILIPEYNDFSFLVSGILVIPAVMMLFSSAAVGVISSIKLGYGTTLISILFGFSVVGLLSAGYGTTMYHAFENKYLGQWLVMVVCIVATIATTVWLPRLNLRKEG